MAPGPALSVTYFMTSGHGVARGAYAIDVTWVAVWYSYKRSFAPPFDIGIGAASAYVLTLIIGALALTYVTIIYRRID